MTDTLLRQWTMLRHIPRAPRKIDTATLSRHLADQGFDINTRSIQRDLQKLSAVFPLVCDEAHRPYGWSWLRDAETFSLPNMDLGAALAFRLAEAHLSHLLPAATRSSLQPWFDQAHRVLEATDGNELARWPEKVRVIPQGQPLEPPHIPAEVLEAVNTALLGDRQLEVTYCRRGEDEPRQYVLNPLGLVYRDAVAYLVATVGAYTNVLMFLLHRMSAATALDTGRRMPQGFSLDAFIRSRAFDFLLSEDPVPVELLFDACAAPRVIETRLAADQILAVEPDGRVRVRARVADTIQLRGWLRGFGELVEVVSPAPLRAEFAETARQLAALYAS